MWAAGRIALQGGNVYDPASLAQQMYPIYPIGWPRQEIVYGLLYPPWTMWLFEPIGALSFPTAEVVWGCLIATTCLLCIRLCFRLQDGKQLSLNLLSPSRLVLACIAFPPLIKLAVFGQSVFVSLLGLTLFCYCFQREDHFRAGFAISLTLIKPHLLLPVFAALTVSALRTRNLKLLLGGFTGFLIQVAVSGYLYPQGASLCLDLLLRNSIHISPLRAPTLGQIASYFLQIDWASPLLLIVGLAAGIIYGVSKHFNM
jgi:hypothetical protein